jgi:LacI family transcriptional regulator
MYNTEIAKLAGVSRSTISRVIKNYPNVPQKTREKVMKIIEEHNYFPNISGQVLAGKKTNIIHDTKDVESIKKIKELFYQRRIDGGIFINAANHEPLIEELIMNSNKIL